MRGLLHKLMIVATIVAMSSMLISMASCRTAAVWINASQDCAAVVCFGQLEIVSGPLRPAFRDGSYPGPGISFVPLRGNVDIDDRDSPFFAKAASTDPELSESSVPLYLPAVLLWIPLYLLWNRELGVRETDRLRSLPPVCRACGYDLFGHEPSTCPRCGITMRLTSGWPARRRQKVELYSPARTHGKAAFHVAMVTFFCPIQCFDFCMLAVSCAACVIAVYSLHCAALFQDYAHGVLYARAALLIAGPTLLVSAASTLAAWPHLLSF